MQNIIENLITYVKYNCLVKNNILLDKSMFEIFWKYKYCFVIGC